MSNEQMAFIVRGYWDHKAKWHSNEEELNELLKKGWRAVTASPMGAMGYGYGTVSRASESSLEYHESGFASLVILER